MSGLSSYSYTTIKQAILDYTEVDSNVFTTTILDGFIMAAEHRINLDCPMDSDRFQDQAQFATDFNSITMPPGLLFVRGIQVFDSTTATTGEGVWLERRDQTFIQEYVGELTGTTVIVGPKTSQTETHYNSLTVPLVSNATSAATGGGFQCTIGPVNDRG